MANKFSKPNIIINLLGRYNYFRDPTLSAFLTNVDNILSTVLWYKGRKSTSLEPMCMITISDFSLFNVEVTLCSRSFVLAPLKYFRWVLHFVKELLNIFCLYAQADSKHNHFSTIFSRACIRCVRIWLFFLFIVCRGVKTPPNFKSNLFILVHPPHPFLKIPEPTPPLPTPISLTFKVKFSSDLKFYGCF